MTTNKKYYSNQHIPAISNDSEKSHNSAFYLYEIPRLRLGMTGIIKKIFFSLFLTGVFLLPAFCSAKVVINEITWMGITTTNDEWIELYNRGEEEINFSGWKIENAGSGNKTLEISGKISPKDFFLICRKEIENCDLPLKGISLHNEYNKNGKLVLLDNLNNIIDQTPEPDGKKWPAGDNKTKQTMERKSPLLEGSNPESWQNSQNPGGTPKQENSSPQENHKENSSPESPKTEIPVISAASNYPPYAEAGPDITALTNQKLVFDGSKSWDPDWNKPTFFWNFGDGATDALATTTHSYLYPGQYIVTLTVSDGQFSDIDALTVNVFDNSVIVSEFSLKQGWIELFNQSGQIANLSSWRLNNFVFPENSLIAPKQYLTLTKEITRLESNGQISLMYPDGSTACQINYEKDKPGTTMAFNGQGYFWTNLATPGSLNLIDLADLKKSYLTTNNPSVQTKPTEEKIALEQKDIFSVKTAETEKETDNDKPEENKYGASLSQAASQAAATGEKKKLILIISIVVFSSFILALAIIFLKRKIFN